MPLSGFQHEVLALLAGHRTPDSYLAGGAALHFAPNSERISNDLGFFHDSVARVASAFAEDADTLVGAGIDVETEISQPGFVRAIIRRDDSVTRIDWAHDSAWRFMPTVIDPLGGFLLHDVDLAVNKTLALAGRDEARDFVDILYVDRTVLPLGGLIWAAVGKDPGFNPLSLLELLKRRGRYQAVDFERLDLVVPFDLQSAKHQWLGALDRADDWIRSRPANEAGCLYYSRSRDRFVMTSAGDASGDVVPHYGRAGGVLPELTGRAISQP